MNLAEPVLRLHAAFHARDWQTMQGCYHPEATFRDPAFGELTAAEVRAMWQMLIERAPDLRVAAGPVTVQEPIVTLTWEAWYPFGPARRPVHNRIDSSIEVRDGLIYRHVDHFDLWRWSRQALGPVGWLLGWSPWVQARVRSQARGQLARFKGRQAAAA